MLKHQVITRGEIDIDSRDKYFIHMYISLSMLKQKNFSETETTDQDILWLQSNDEPEHLVLEKWCASFTTREPCKNVVQYFRLYKCLRFHIGP